MPVTKLETRGHDLRRPVRKIKITVMRELEETNRKPIGRLISYRKMILNNFMKFFNPRLDFTSIIHVALSDTTFYYHFK